MTTQIKIELARRGVSGNDLARAMGWSVEGRYVHRVLRREETISGEKANLVGRWMKCSSFDLFDEVEGRDGPRYLAKPAPNSWKAPW